MNAVLPDSAYSTEFQELLEAAADALSRLTAFPSATDLSAALRAAAATGSLNHMSVAAIESLGDIHTRLCAESSPDFWLDMVAGAGSNVDADTMQTALDVADERRHQAVLVNAVLGRLANKASTPDPSETRPAGAGEDVR